MDWKVIKREWSVLVPSILETWPEADEAELLDLDGTRAALAAYLAEVTERPVEDIEDELSEWRTGGIPADIRMDALNDNVNITSSGRYIGAGEDVYDDDKAFGDDNEAEPPVGRS